jgi:hypothetical protein
MAFSSFGEILRQVRNRYPSFSKRLREAEALVRWEGAVGPVIAKHTRAIRIQEGVLWVEVDHPIWRQELHLRRRQILEILNRPAGSPAPASQAPQTHADAPITDILFVDPRSEGKPGARTFAGSKKTSGE